MFDTYITLTGWVGSDVTLREVAGGQPVASFRVATTSRRFRNNEWKDGNTTWYQVKAWRSLADNVAGSIKSGDPVVVHGRLEADVWTKDDGTVNTQLVVTATSVGHDLSRGTAVFTKPARPESALAAAQQPVTSDPWAAPLSQPIPAFATDAPAAEAASEVAAAEAA
jgi:single-strand DNA-binding protein